MKIKGLILVLSLIAIVGTAGVSAQSDFLYDVEIPEATATLALDEAIEGELTEATPILAYSIDLVAGDTVQISVDFDEFDGYLLIADADGNVIAFNDDGSGIYNSTVPVFQPLEEGTYLVAVTTYPYVTSDGEASSIEGTFELSASSVVLTPIAVGDEVAGELTEDNLFALYSLEVAEGQILAITMEADDFDAQLFVTPGEGQDQDQLFNDDFDDEFNAQVGPYLFTEAGAYTIRATSFFDEAGEYTLRVTESEPIALAVGETVRGEVVLGNLYAHYSFAGIAGQEVDIQVEAVEDIDLSLVFYGPDNSVIDTNDDSNGLNPELMGVELEDDGTYIILVQPFGIFFAADELGEFDITVTAN